jgi:hypothetical protein
MHLEMTVIQALQSALLCLIIIVLQTALTTMLQLGPTHQALFLLAGLSYLTVGSGAFEYFYLIHLSACLLTALISEVFVAQNFFSTFMSEL